jgi:hypothetical protein
LNVTGVPLTPGTTTVFVGAAFAAEHPARTSTAATTILRTRLSSMESIPWNSVPRLVCHSFCCWAWRVILFKVPLSALPSSHLGPPGSKRPIPGLLLGRRRERPGCVGFCRQGTRGGYFKEEQAPWVLGLRPSQKSQASPGRLQPRALGYARPIALRCRRQSTACIVTSVPS